MKGIDDLICMKALTIRKLNITKLQQKGSVGFKTADASSVSSLSERIEELWVVHGLYKERWS